MLVETPVALSAQQIYTIIFAQRGLSFDEMRAQMEKTATETLPSLYATTRKKLTSKIFVTYLDDTLTHRLYKKTQSMSSAPELIENMKTELVTWGTLTLIKEELEKRRPTQSTSQHPAKRLRE